MGLAATARQADGSYLETRPADPGGVMGGGLGGRRRLVVLGAVALGRALAAPARYGISRLVFITPGTFPWGTFWTNISGSFALGLVLAVILERFPPTS